MTQHGTIFSYFRELILFYMASTRFTSVHANIEMSTDDSPEREFDDYDSEDLPVATLEHEESTSILSESETITNRSNAIVENLKPSQMPRREVWWLDLGATNHSLESIGRCFENRLNWSLLSSSNSLLRHVKSSKDDNLRRNLHQCPGYLREEITLTCDLSKSAIVSYAFPGPSERCSICHQLVQYTYSNTIDCNDIYYPPTLNNSLSLPPTGEGLMFDHIAPVEGIDPFTSKRVDLSDVGKSSGSFRRFLSALFRSRSSRASTPSLIEKDSSSDKPKR